MAITVLILEDNPADLTLVQRTVETDFPEVTVLTARSFDEAHAYVGDGYNINLFLVADPIGDYRAIDFLGDLRTVLPTAQAMIMQEFHSHETQEREEELGIVGVLQKPIPMELLRQALTVYLHLSPEKASGFQFVLNHSSLEDLLAWKSTHPSIGALTIRSGSQIGRIYLGKGEILYAAAGTATLDSHHFEPSFHREEAVLEILKWKSGKVTDGSNEPCPEGLLLHKTLLDILLNRNTLKYNHDNHTRS